MENTLHATRPADIPAMPKPGRPALEKCVVPIAPTCFLLLANAQTRTRTPDSIAVLSDYLREIVKTYHAFGAANLTFIISDLQALQLGGFFTPENQRALVGDMAIELHYLFASESGVVHSSSSSRTLTYWAKYFAKEGAL
ncbi:hypothetical protein D9M09_06410 [Janthinobacterium agaricidamnosum]|uniref:Uncharacterized protein n=1 Tax=Janthinobacterium agaricidamnosum TaxID=55508 RepID=A0A3G2E6R0_9BURK|nr:hypothetical protein [Janthinobacterium agaricidamnosum]AYM75470.1 hypothetical protein D9M09_06410 [Janthinobacterium agaricidamnosum]